MHRDDWRGLALCAYFAALAWLALIGAASILMGRW